LLEKVLVSVGEIALFAFLGFGLINTLGEDDFQVCTYRFKF